MMVYTRYILVCIPTATHTSVVEGQLLVDPQRNYTAFGYRDIISTHAIMEFTKESNGIGYIVVLYQAYSPPFHRGFLRFDHPWTLGGTIAHGNFNKNPTNIEYPYFLKSPSFEPSDSYYKVLDICRKPKGILVESGPLGVYGAGNICKRSSWGRQAVELDQTWTRRRENKTHREHCDV